MSGSISCKASTQTLLTNSISKKLDLPSQTIPMGAVQAVPGGVAVVAVGAAAVAAEPVSFPMTEPLMGVDAAIGLRAFDLVEDRETRANGCQFCQ
jgi:hypothetical protein